MQLKNFAPTRSFFARRKGKEGKPSSSYRRAYVFYCLLLLSMLSLLINFLPNNLIDPFASASPQSHNIAISPLKRKIYIDKEFDRRLPRRFNTISSIIYYVNKHVRNVNDKKEKLELLSKIVRRRFHHAYAVYGLRENWIAVFAGLFVWKDLAAKVIPCEILQNDVSACSQASIVMMKCCHILGMNTRKVGLVGHYALEAEIDKKWYFIDANIKPNFSAIGGRESLDSILKNNEKFALYANTVLDSASIKTKFSKVVYGKINEDPAPRAYIFQKVTGVLSHWLWLALLIAAIFYDTDTISNHPFVKKIKQIPFSI